MAKAPAKTSDVAPPKQQAPMLNHLLLTLSSPILDRLAADLRRERLTKGRSLYRPGDRADRLFFPEDAVLSVSAQLRTGGLVETNVVGREGAVGLIEASARGVMTAQVRVHSAGDAWCISAESFRAATAQNLDVQTATHHHTEDVVAELRQSVLCHTLHTLDQRLCRWILERQDQINGGSISVTRACLADILGAQRTSVSETASRLQKRGLIRSVRATIVVVDRPGLEAAACECRATLQTARDTKQATGPHLEPRRARKPARSPSAA